MQGTYGRNNIETDWKWKQRNHSNPSYFSHHGQGRALITLLRCLAVIVGREVIFVQHEEQQSPWPPPTLPTDQRPTQTCRLSFEVRIPSGERTSASECTAGLAKELDIRHYSYPLSSDSLIKKVGTNQQPVFSSITLEIRWGWPLCLSIRDDK